MHISAPTVHADGNSVVVSANFDSGSENGSLWFKLDVRYREYVVTERGDAFLIGLLLYAMARGEPIHIDCPISERLYYGLTRYLMPALAMANPELHPVHIVPSGLQHKDINSADAVGTGFSGGVDAFETVYSHVVNPECPPRFRLTHLAFFNVGSHGDFGGAQARTLFRERLANLNGYLTECGLECVVVDSNLSEILQMNFEETHTLRSMAPVMLLQKLFRRYYYSSGIRMDDFAINKLDMAFYDILNSSMLSTESLEIYPSGCQLTRVEKTAIIADYEPTWRYLNVCACSDRNCSACFKCMRTLLTLDILGKLESYSRVFDLSIYRRHRSRYLGQVLAGKRKLLLKDIYNEMVRKNVDFPATSRLFAWKYRCTAGLRQATEALRRGRV